MFQNRETHLQVHSPYVIKQQPGVESAPVGSLRVQYRARVPDFWLALCVFCPSDAALSVFPLTYINMTRHEGTTRSRFILTLISYACVVSGFFREFMTKQDRMIKFTSIPALFLFVLVSWSIMPHIQATKLPSHHTDPSLNVWQAVITVLVTVSLFLKGLFFTAALSIVKVLYGIRQDGCWWDTKINKGNFVSLSLENCSFTTAQPRQ